MVKVRHPSERNSPFKGRTFLLTRSPEDNAVLKQTLERTGAHVHEWPLYHYEAVKLKQIIWRCLEDLQAFDWIVFTSARAVTFFMREYTHVTRQKKLPDNLKIAAVGKATATELKQYGIKVTLVPREKSSAGLAQEKVFSRTKKLRIFFPQVKGARRAFAENLSHRHQIVSAVFYQKKIIRHSAAAKKILLQKNIDWILFFSPSAVECFIKSVGKNNARKIFTAARIAVIGTTTRDYLDGLSILTRRVDVVAKNGDIEDLLLKIGRLKIPV